MDRRKRAALAGALKRQALDVGVKALFNDAADHGVPDRHRELMDRLAAEAAPLDDDPDEL